LNAKVFDGRYIKRSGEMLVWVSDDPTRAPLRARIKTSGATITVELKRIPSKVTSTLVRRRIVTAARVTSPDL
jgi:hypothetical protein